MGTSPARPKWHQVCILGLVQNQRREFFPSPPRESERHQRPRRPRRGWEDSTLNETAPGHLWVSYVAGSGAVEAPGTRWSVDAMVAAVAVVAVVVKGHTSPLPNGVQRWPWRQMCCGARVMRCPVAAG